jgi:hypothetical protein
MVHLGRPPLPPNRPYRQPLNYPKYVKDSNPNAHVRIFQTVIKTNSETNDARIFNLFNFTLRDTMFDWCNNYLGNYLDCTFVKLYLTFYERYKKVQNDEQVYLQLKNMK